MPVGNDVVDIGHPLCQPDAIHPRFDSRAFSASEIALLATAADTHRTRWSLWATKESAFKAARKLDPRVRFIPRDFVVRLSGARATVIHRRARFKVWLDETDEWIHAVASLGGGKPVSRVDGLPSDCGRIADIDPSERVRRLACSELAAQLNIAQEAVRIVTSAGIPRARQQGTRGLEEYLPVDLSLSHDGPFVACAWNPIPDESEP